MINTTHYFAHIDGLRAIAVLMVVFFHAFPSLLPGGFIGVDVFFVISGFLITKIIIQDIHQKKFSVRTFFARRTQRIFPALMLVLVTGWCIGWFALTSNEYSKYGKYMAGGAVFLDNFMFWRDAGYFDSKHDTKPLLHLWSLGVEEQFYLVWPWLLLAFARTKYLIQCTLLLVVLSFAYNIHLSNTNPVGDFYSPVTRFWELGSGAVLALIMHQSGSNYKTLLSQNRTQWLSILGLAILLIGLLWIDSSVAFPGYWAALPVLATLLLIVFGAGKHWISRGLQHPLMVHIGLISFPLYLWHWPLLSFARIFNGSTPSPWIRVEMLLLAFVLAEMTYRFIEKPIRQTPPSRLKISSLLLLMMAAFALGHWVSIKHGLSWRNHEKLKADPVTMVVGADRDQLLRDCLLTEEELHKASYCLSNAANPQDPIWLVIGDSKAEAIYYGLVRESPQNIRWVLIGGTTPLNQASWSATAFARWSKDPQIAGVVFASAWRGHTPTIEDTDRPLKEPDATTIDHWLHRYGTAIALFKNNNKQVIVLKDHPTLPDPNDCIEGQMVQIPVLSSLLHRHANPLCSQKRSDHVRWTASFDQLTAKLLNQHPGLKVFNPVDDLCDAQIDRCEIHQENKFLYSYGDHLSDHSNSLLAKKMYSAGYFKP
jgi:peptidoglycan/LPS O-acetylase OafA/YrhL